MRTVVVGLLFAAACGTGDAQPRAGVASVSSQEDFARMRERMVAEQMAARDIKDPRVLAAMRKVPRHLFVPADQQRLAYEDHPLPIGQDQTISQPYIVAYMSQALELKPTHKVLEIGTGWPEHAPFDAIMVTAAPDHVPQPLIDQLAPGGRMIIPVGDYFQELRVIQRTEQGIVQRSTIPVRFVPLTRNPR